MGSTIPASGEGERNSWTRKKGGKKGGSSAPQWQSGKKGEKKNDSGIFKEKKEGEGKGEADFAYGLRGRRKRKKKRPSVSGFSPRPRKEKRKKRGGEKGCRQEKQMTRFQKGKRGRGNQSSGERKKKKKSSNPSVRREGKKGKEEGKSSVTRVTFSFPCWQRERRKEGGGVGSLYSVFLGS